MKLSHFFIDRPIFAIVISVITIILGSIAYTVAISQRITIEEKVLFANPDYRAAMAGKPRFLPGLF